MESMMQLFQRIANPALAVRKITIGANHVRYEKEIQEKQSAMIQGDLFEDCGISSQQEQKENERLAKERRLQQTLLQIKKQFGKNSVLKAMSLQEGATARERNMQVGGHK